MIKFENSVVHSLNSSTYKFVLTGSRFFGTCRPESDWDFFTDNGEAIQQYLVSYGFKRLETSSYVDSSIVEVLRHPDGVDVQLVEDAGLKAAAQQILAGMLAFLPRDAFVDGKKRKEIWDAALRTAKSLRKA